MNIRQIIREEYTKIIKENNNPTVAPTKPKTKPTTKPSKPTRRRPLTPPRTAPQTTPKAKLKENDIEDFEVNPEDTGSYGIKPFGPQNKDIVSTLEEVAELISNNQGEKALALVNSIIAEFNQVGGGSQLNEDEKQIAKAMAKRFLSKKK